MPFFKIRTTVKKLLPPDQASNDQLALEHILEAIANKDKSLVTVQRIPGDDAHVKIPIDLAELITIWRWGYELKDQDNRTLALICKLLKIKA